MQEIKQISSKQNKIGFILFFSIFSAIGLIWRIRKTTKKKLVLWLIILFITQMTKTDKCSKKKLAQIAKELVDYEQEKEKIEQWLKEVSWVKMLVIRNLNL